MSRTTLSLDYEGGSETQLVGPASVGLYNYANDLSTRIFMLAYAWNDGPVQHVDFTKGGRWPPEVIEALLDPEVEKWAFNAGFERMMTMLCAAIATPVRRWRCTMVRAYMLSFTGGLGDVGEQIGLDADKLKDPMGKRLIHKFCHPQKITKNQPHLWRNHQTDPEDWELFCRYNVRDVESEIAQKQWLIKHPVPEREWELYEIDQQINDRGLPVDRKFVQNAIGLVQRRKAELTDMLSEVTTLANPNSTPQLLPWLQERGYPFDDLKKDTVKKVLNENKETPILDESAVAALKLRQQASRTSVKKYDQILRRIGDDDALRHCFQFAGAARTNRWAGRGPQPQNLVRTPKMLEPEGGSYAKLEAATDAIRQGDYDLLTLLVEEPMTALAGCMRSSFQSTAGHDLVVADLSAIETAVIAWLSGCKRLLRVFAEGKDPYKDFAMELYKIVYEAVTKEMRGICKPPQLGCGFGLGGGKLVNGKRTGLWGYAEAMGVDITQEAAIEQVRVWREVYPEIPVFWKAIEQACIRCLRGQTVRVGLLTFRRVGEFMVVDLPSGRPVYYHKPRMMVKEFPSNDGGTYTRNVFTHMGKSQVTHKWQRIISGGPKLCENFVQGTARDILGEGVRHAWDFGFDIRGTVHDEVITLQRAGDNQFNVPNLISCMTENIDWTRGLPLKAAGWASSIYHKD